MTLPPEYYLQNIQYLSNYADAINKFGKKIYLLLINKSINLMKDTTFNSNFLLFEPNNFPNFTAFGLFQRLAGRLFFLSSYNASHINK